MAAPRYLPRSWWADSDWSRGGAQLVDDDLHRLGNVCHYPGRASAFGRLSLASLRNNLRGWWNYHVNTRGWSDIGYQIAVAHTNEGPVVVDLRGIGRVPAAHASTSNPRANWHGGATLWVVGNTEQPTRELIDAYRHFRTTVWLPRWPTATGVTGHRLVPGASTGCPGDPIIGLVNDGELTKPFQLPPEPEEDDMPTPGELWRHEIDGMEAGDRLVLTGNRAARAQQHASRAVAETRALAELSGVSLEALQVRADEILAELQDDDA